MVIIRIFLATMFLFILIAVLSFVYLKWWQAMLVCVAVAAIAVLGVRLAIWMFVNRIGSAVGGVFERRGEALRGASVEVHSIEPGEAPPSQQQIDDFRKYRQANEPGYVAPDAPKRYYRMDVTIRTMPPAPVQSRAGGVQVMTAAMADTWTPMELTLVPLNDPVEPDPPSNVPGMVKMMRQFTSGYRLEQVVEPGTGEAGERAIGEVTEGPRAKRFNFLVGVPAGIPELKFKYYGESFGHIVLPGAG